VRALTTAYWTVGAHRDAADTALRWVSLAADSDEKAQAHFALGIALAASSDREPSLQSDAETALRKALELDGERMNQARFHLGLLLMRRSQDEAGQRALSEYLAKDPMATDAPRARQLIDDPACARETCLPDFSLLGEDSRVVTLADAKGKALVILVDYYRGQSRSTFPSSQSLLVQKLDRLAERYREEGVVFLGIDATPSVRNAAGQQEDRSTMPAWARYRMVQGRYSRPLGVSGYPAVLVVDERGRVAAMENGWGEEAFNNVARSLADVVKAAKRRAKQQ
jgi:hypothetical protein